ncbi:uncharacterized protein LOC111004752 [Momordica charantia]|uniref:Uncharacterized protein LOC111004752 n=1 Tax=Momordica charantia TaxID=3673 RepID=A0A6J1BQ03_MOMCH|nr:uncharacterized protein LOC111004752 [Momordica charantia]
MKRRDPKAIAKPTAPPADLLVCFPARARLTLLPKPACSPARAPADSALTRRHHHPKKPPAVAAAPAHASPLLWGAKEMGSEPTSPKVTCAGQIKIRPHATKNWQSVMEEIERIHKKKKIPNSRNRNQNPLGFKREIVNFLSCLRGFRFDFRCFRGIPESDVTTEDESESEPESESEEEPAEASRTMFSKWFMVLQEEEEETRPRNGGVSAAEAEPSSGPPPNALLLMRCRSAPSMGCLQRNPKAKAEEEQQSKISLKLLMEKEEVNPKNESLVVMDYDADFYRLSADIAKETWVVSGSNKSNESDDPLIRSRSWKRW